MHLYEFIRNPPHKFKIVMDGDRAHVVPRGYGEGTEFYQYCYDKYHITEDTRLLKLLSDFDQFDLELDVTWTNQQDADKPPERYNVKISKFLPHGASNHISRKKVMQKLQALEAKAAKESAFAQKHKVPKELAKLAGRLEDQNIDLGSGKYNQLINTIQNSEEFKNHQALDYTQIAGILGFYYDRADRNTRFALRAFINVLVERGDLSQINGLEKFTNPSPIPPSVVKRHSTGDITEHTIKKRQEKLANHGWIAEKRTEIAHKQAAQDQLHISPHNPYGPERIKRLFGELSNPEDFRADDFLAHFDLAEASKNSLKKAKGYITEILNDLAQTGEIHSVSPKRYSVKARPLAFAQHLQLKKFDEGDEQIIGLVDPFWDEDKKGPQPKIVVGNVPPKFLNNYIGKDDIYIDAAITRQENGSYMADIENICDIKEGIDLARSQNLKPILRPAAEKREQSKTEQGRAHLAEKKGRREARAAGIEANKADQKARKRKQREHSKQMNEEAANRQKNEAAGANTSGASSAWLASKAGKGSEKQKPDAEAMISTGSARLDALLEGPPPARLF